MVLIRRVHGKGEYASGLLRSQEPDHEPNDKAVDLSDDKTIRAGLIELHVEKGVMLIKDLSLNVNNPWEIRGLEFSD